MQPLSQFHEPFWRPVPLVEFLEHPKIELSTSKEREYIDFVTQRKSWGNCGLTYFARRKLPLIEEITERRS